jgi:Hemerythrin HHE cation binding domain
MATRNLPGSDASRHGTGDADLTIMLAAHAAFRRDLTSLARATAPPYRPDPTRYAAIQAGWETFKRQLHIHHTAEDEVIWPTLRPRLVHSEHAQSVLDAMEDEHQLIDPLLAAVDAAFAEPDGSSLGEATDALTTELTSHLSHEERDGLPLIGIALTSAEWRAAGFKIARHGGLSSAAEMFAWIADGAPEDQAAAAIATLPPPARLIYRAIWSPRYHRTKRW